MRLLSLSEASIQERKGPVKFARSPCTDPPGLFRYAGCGRREAEEAAPPRFKQFVTAHKLRSKGAQGWFCSEVEGVRRLLESTKDIRDKVSSPLCTTIAVVKYRFRYP